jgi:hypothetical protein
MVLGESCLFFLARGLAPSGLCFVASGLLALFGLSNTYLAASEDSGMRGGYWLIIPPTLEGLKLPIWAEILVMGYWVRATC